MRLTLVTLTIGPWLGFGLSLLNLYIFGGI